MKKFFKRKNNFFHLIILTLCISSINTKYKEIELKLKKGPGTDYDLPLYIETNDSCTKWVPALFSPILIINNGINSENYTLTSFQIKVQNPDSIKENKNAMNMEVFSYNISIFNEINIAKSKSKWPSFCRFGLDYSEVLSGKKDLNAIKNLIPKQLDKNIFSFGKWDLNNKDFIYSKFYIGDSHENFLEDVGTCNIQNETGYYGCIFNDFIFSTETYSLINENNNKSYIIYFSSEFNKIYFPKSFEKKIKNCKTENEYFPEFICEDLKNKDYMPLILRNDNMNITLEVDKINRFYNYLYVSEGSSNIIFHEYEYFIFPLTMLKNFHTQFDVEKKIISFYTDDISILEIKRKKSNKSDETEKPKNEGISTGLLVVLIILGILLILGIGYGGFLIYKKKYPNMEEKFNKYSRFNDESDLGISN